MKNTIEINGRTIGAGHPAYIIAEMSGNHNKSYNRAVEIIHAMKASGADAVKLQTYTADTLTIDCDREEFLIGKGTLWEGKTLYQLYEEANTPWEWHADLKEEAESLGMDLFSTPFDDSAVAFLENLLVPAYKVASFEMNDLELLREVAKTGQPMIISTGMATAEEIQDALDAVHAEGNEQIVLLKCTSAYPSPPEAANLKTIPDMQKRYSTPIGLSDHTLGIEVPVAAVTLGACVIEKHFCLSRKEEGVDSAFSLEPKEFREMVDAVRHAEAHHGVARFDPVVLGKVSYGPTEHEKPSTVFRRSLFVVQDVKKGEIFTRENVRCIRPGNGLPPKELPNVLGKTATENIERGTPLSTALITS